MPYNRHFQIADDMISHLDTAILGISDPFIQSRYVGFVAVAAVTVYELAIKEIFCEFGAKKHKVLGTFTKSYFDRINGRIQTKVIRDDYIIRFGDKYVRRFNRKTIKTENDILRNRGISVLSCYGNIVQWRNQFTHEGNIPSTPTYTEVKDSYEYGKEIIKCLAETMQR